ncbi:Probable adenylate kinase 6, chloroplastic [Seminavis robusta]|uniref:Probable adenylate kinase 6, chloroplastic n=1 Tax=Seminavis robusta TaxID=568900 RepID=A0A9N8DLQ1_9STRA|nr:Probable adenylate kinase 6, chloroplastic [Seminavis robusta]|eukprot:Sro154_g069930.1 Probable adenylate kinase 6, chloroplastic (259) ;mRNA; f:26781-27557
MFRPRLCLLGSPGSGKGSYGQILARHWGVPIVTVSQVLKQQQQLVSQQDQQDQMASGNLLDDQVVSQAVLEYLSQQQKDATTTTSSYLLDGFPRTIDQIHLMESTWPTFLQVQAAVHLNVPTDVCERKLLGRRICTVCGNHFNIHGVTSGGFDLPPKLPRPGECHRANALGTPSLPQQHNLTKCNAPWMRRDDDQRDVIQHRLQLYAQHTKPILEYYCQQQANSRLFDFVPYRGFQDMARLQTELEEWLGENLPETVQ